MRLFCSLQMLLWIFLTPKGKRAPVFGNFEEIATLTASVGEDYEAEFCDILDKWSSLCYAGH